jgi:hypothetical protein
MPSLPPVSAKVIADAEQFVQEFRRAERAARGSAEGIEREVGGLVDKVQKKFRLADFGKDVLKGAGLFGGFDIARTASEKISDHFREAAEHAKNLSGEIERQVSATERLLALRRTDDQNLEAMQAKMLRMARERTELLGPHDLGRAGRSQRMLTRDANPEEIQKAAALATQMQELAVQIEQAKLAKARRDTEELVKRVAVSGSGADMRAWKEITAEDEARAAEGLRKWNEELETQAEALRKLGDPMRQYQQRLEEIADLVSLGKLSDDEAWAAKVKTWGDIADEANKANRGKGSLADLKEVLDVSPDIEKTNDAARELGLTFSSAFEDAVIGGGKLSDVLHGLEQDILRIAMRKAITEPLGNAVAGIFSGGFGKLFGFASGGDFTVGGSGGTDTTPVAFMATPGETVSVRTPGQRAGGGGGGTYYIDARGADRTGLAELKGMILALNGSIEERAVGAVLNQAQRSTGFRRALA